MDELIDIII